MKNTNFKIYDCIDQLENIWDEKFKKDALSSFISLKNLENTNPCFQKYHVDLSNHTFLLSYKLNLNLFTFKGPFNLKLPLNIIGLPFSVSKKGYSVNNLDDYIKKMKGFKLILNSNDTLNLPKGYTLPSCVLHLNFKSFDEYFSLMRSSYRYRLKKALNKGKDLFIHELKDNGLFDEELYKLYIQVYENSKEKLEKLSIHFFKTYPSRIFVFKHYNKPIAFVQLVENGEELIFLFGGFEKNLNLKYDVYFNMLLFMVKYGIENNFKRIDMGQTAEESKLKVGCTYEKKYMYLHHSNTLINTILKFLLPHFSYEPYHKKHRIFRHIQKQNNSNNQ